MALVLDTGVIYAALDENDADHERCAALIATTEETLVVPSPVLVELDYWLRKNASLDVWLAFATDLSSAAYTLWPADARPGSLGSQLPAPDRNAFPAALPRLTMRT